MYTDCTYYVKYALSMGSVEAENQPQKNSVEFADAAVALEDGNAITVINDDSQGEYRFITLCVGPSPDVLVVVHTEEVEEQITIISSRLAEPSERQQYYEGINYGY